MSKLKSTILVVLLFFINSNIIAKENSKIIINDTITLGQAYINLFLTSEYIDSLDSSRITKILNFEKKEIEKIIDKSFIKEYNTLFKFTNSLLFYNTAFFSYQSEKNINREKFIQIKNELKKSIEQYNSSKLLKNNKFLSYNNLYSQINFDEISGIKLLNKISEFKKILNKHFNNDIYNDFKELLLKSKEENIFNLDSLHYISNIYDLNLNMDIVNNNYAEQLIIYDDYDTISPYYTPTNKINLISKYFQFENLAKKSINNEKINTKILYSQFDEFIFQISQESDSFISKELSVNTTNKLLNRLKIKYPYNTERVKKDTFRISNLINSAIIPYFFSNPAPKPSTLLLVNNYKPELQTLNQVDLYFRSKMQEAGFESNHLHYYYDMDGYAMTTSLEKFNKDGTKVSSDKRFTESMGEGGKFSYFEIFKSIFFDVESEFRMFAFIVASKPATLGSNNMTTSFAEEILQNSYPTLPNDLKVKTLPTKDLTILVYHFHQNDIGQVPELDLSGSWEVQDHLRSAGIQALN